ncbi:MAG: response regulator [Gammaproteobacteria bacterium]|nr:response regulator [Gammaproteobacteria bacterium]
MSQSNKRYLTPGEAAELLMVTPMTLRRWVQQGLMKPQTTVGGHRRYLVADLLHFARKQGLHIEEYKQEAHRILIVDDNFGLSRFLHEALERLCPGLQAQVASSGFEAGHKLLSFEPHAVVLDLMMPDMDGFEVCRMIKESEKTEGITVIAITGYPSDENAKRIIDCGATSCLAKPVDLCALLDALDVPVEPEQLQKAGLSLRDQETAT